MRVLNGINLLIAATLSITSSFAADAAFAARPLTYTYKARLCTTDGGEDLIHGDRLARLLPFRLPLSRAYVRSDRREDPDIDYDARTLNLNVNGGESDMDIQCSYCPYPTPEKTNLLISEYDSCAHYLQQYKHAIWAPLGLTYGLGYMKPLLPIDHDQSKHDLFYNLDPQLRHQIYGEDGSAEATLLVMAYCSPRKGFPELILKAFAESPYARDKKTVFFATGDVDKLKATIGESGTIVMPSKRVPDDQWHILSQLADASSVATGDFSASDPFFFRTLPFWNCHKRLEAKAWFMAATDWEAPEAVDKERVVRYIELLRNSHEQEEKLSDFVRELDQSFMRDWKKFCIHIEENYTLTQTKVAAVIAIATQMHFARLEKEREMGEMPEHDKLMRLFENTAEVLPKETIDCFKLSYHIKTRKFQHPYPSDFQRRNLYFLGYSETWK